MERSEKTVANGASSDKLGCVKNRGFPRRVFAHDDVEAGARRPDEIPQDTKALDRQPLEHLDLTSKKQCGKAAVMRFHAWTILSERLTHDRLLLTVPAINNAHGS